MFIEISGGSCNTFFLRLRRWDIEVNGVAVEFDEERHFNRYREITLQSKAYALLPHFPLHEYIEFCRRYEANCLKSANYGGYWTNTSCEKQFGSASKPGNLSGQGTSRWKQRAFYDFLKDLSPLIIGIPLVRISIWDRVTYKGTEFTLKQMLETGRIDIAKILLELIRERVAPSELRQ